MNTDERTWLDQVVNVHIHRTQRKVTVGFSRRIPLLDRQYRVFEWLMREPNIRKEHNYSEIARGAFDKTELVPNSAIAAILGEIKRSLVAYGAYRGFLIIPSYDRVQLYAPSQKVKVTAFHVPTARFESGPADGSVSPGPELVEPVWEGDVTEKGDPAICEDVFQFLNRDDRPNGRFAPSLSVGDVVTIAAGTIEAVSYQAAGTGWIRLREAVTVDAHAIDAMKKQLTGRPFTVALTT